MNLLKRKKLKAGKAHRTLKQKFNDDLEFSVKNYENKDKDDRNLNNTKFIFWGFVFLIIIIFLSYLLIF